ncbi:MAG: hypothetical protein IJF88_01325 [Oscillospiraceae bacterium]|nr:hypothetical protein [Oscillospiraceae bacterium]
MTYSYDPTKIRERGKDQMRFELGDTETEGGKDTCALSDEEYAAYTEDLREGKKAWLFAKLAVLEAICIKMQYMVNTRIDVLSYDFGERASRWLKMRDALKKEILAASSVPTMAPSIENSPPYFHKEMKSNPRAMSGSLDFPFRRMTT